MQSTIEGSVVIEKTRELCQTILEQPHFQQMRQQIDAFLANEEAKQQYQLVVQKGESLNHKQQMGASLDASEIADFEAHRDALVNNSVAKGFLDAQQEMQKVQESVSQYVTKTIELGRVPGAEDFDSSCGHGCGCHH